MDGSKKMVRFANVDDSRLSVILVNAPLTTQQLPRLRLGVSRAEKKVPHPCRLNRSSEPKM